MTLGNPLGLLALLGLPAVLAVHFLQRRAKREVVSTLFLLTPLHRESESGRRWERLRTSWPLWLQLLAVLVLAWLMAEPRWLEKNSVQRVALVLDGSASMRVSKERLVKYLGEDLGELGRVSGTTEYTVLDSRVGQGRLYHGTELRGVVAAVEKWVPAAGTHDPGPALRLGRSLSGPDGVVWYVTDHAVETSVAGVQVYAVGESAENCGIAGVTVEETAGRRVWRALLRNYSDRAVERTWRVTDRSGAASVPEKVTIPARGNLAVQGAFPDGSEGLVIAVDADVFPLDDVAPVLRPRPRRLAAVLPEGAGDASWRKLVESLPDFGVTADAGLADLEIVETGGGAEVAAERPGVVFVKAGDGAAAAPMRGVVLVERHPLTQDLNWQAVAAEAVPGVAMREGDEVLVWIGDRALVMLRGGESRRQLIFNFDPARSNALRQPAMVVTLLRFLEDRRGRVPREEVANVDCGQLVDQPLGLGSGDPAVEMTWETVGVGGVVGKAEERSVAAERAAVLRAPEEPAFFKVRQGGRTVLTAAAGFRDAREADFSKAVTKREVEAVREALSERHSQADGHWRLWVLVLLGLLLGSWLLAGKARRTDQREGGVVGA